MKHEPKLVAAVVAEMEQSRDHVSNYSEWAERILDAINASGTHWVAPWEIDRHEFPINMSPWPEDSDVLFARIRDAYLALSAEEMRGE